MNCQDILGDKTPQDLRNTSFHREVVHPYVQELWPIFVSLRKADNG